MRRYLWDDRIITRDEALAPLSVSERDFRERRFGLWGVNRPGEATLLGFCGLHLDPERGPLVDSRLPKHWRKVSFNVYYRGERRRFVVENPATVTPPA